MQISREDVVRTLALARLRVPESELPKLVAEFESIVRYVESVSQVPLEGVAPLSHGGEARDVFRADEVRPSLDRAAVLKNAPVAEQGCFVVPRVIAES